MPVDEITRAEEDGLHVSFGEIATLNDTLNSLMDIDGIEFERARHRQTFHLRHVRLREVDNVVVIINGKSLRVGVEMRGNVRERHAPHLGFERIDVGIGNAGGEYNHALMDVVVNHTALLQELRKRECRQAFVVSGVMPQHIVQL